MAKLTMTELVDAGVHFGHQTSRWNPKMKKFIWDKRSDVYVIDLKQTLECAEIAYNVVRSEIAKGGTILFVGTKKQASPIIKEIATSVSMPYIDKRWIGGILTNHLTVASRIQRLKELEEIDFSEPKILGETASPSDISEGQFGKSKQAAKYTKKELLLLEREKNKLEKSLGGIKDMNKEPSLIWVVDTKQEHLAITEAKKLGIPVVGMLDTNCDPDDVDYPIPGNDDAINSIKLITNFIAEAVIDGKQMIVDRIKESASKDNNNEPFNSENTEVSDDEQAIKETEQNNEVKSEEVDSKEK